MKNIHILPTENPSRFYFNNNDKCFQLCKVDKKSTPLKINQHICITNDEEIKEGDWFITTDTNELYKSDWVKFDFNNGKKIILTDNKNLIKDGVQAIDDEFLEWFVKNPSCEEVRVEQEILKLVHNPNYVNHTPEGDGIYLTPKSEDLQYGETLIEDNVIDYKIIIPKEEIQPQQIWNEEKMEGVKKLIQEQEILEEAAENYGWRIKKNTFSDRVKANELAESAKQDFRAGAKWQQEQDKKLYSEEDLDMLRKFMIQEQNFSKSCLDVFIKQFKKK
jgi:hypothetical protein